MHFSPKFRRELRENLLGLRNEIEKCWDLPDEELTEFNLDRGCVVSAAAFSARLLDELKWIEEWARGRVLRDKKFYLYKHKSKKRILIEFKYFKVAEDRHRTGVIAIYNGLPKGRQRKRGMWYKKGLSKKGFRLVQSGTFYQRFVSLQEIDYVFKNSNYYLKLKIRQYGKGPSYPVKIWVSLGGQ